MEYEHLKKTKTKIKYENIGNCILPIIWKNTRLNIIMDGLLGFSLLIEIPSLHP